MPVTINFTEAAVFLALRGLLLQMVPAGVEIIRAQINRVPEPRVLNWIIMTSLMRTRLETNIDTTTDVVFQGTIAGVELAVTGTTAGAIYVGAVIDGPGVVGGTIITSLRSDGIYIVSPSQMVTGTMYAGIKNSLQPVQFDIQLDIHGPASSENAMIISTLFRDEFSTSYFDAGGIDIQALYTSEPRQLPFINAESQYEDRWTIDLSLQTNQIVQVPQQFADQLHAGFIEVDSTNGIIEVDTTFPP